MTRWDKLAQIEAERKQQTDYAAQNSLDAQRYRKLKANQGEAVRIFRNLDMHFEADAAVDALPDVKP